MEKKISRNTNLYMSAWWSEKYQTENGYAFVQTKIRGVEISTHFNLEGVDEGGMIRVPKTRKDYFF